MLCGRLILAPVQSQANSEGVPDKDANKRALEQVEKITESDRDNGEDLLESEDLKRQLREARERLKSESPEPSGQ
jgi:hypothetical protein